MSDWREISQQQNLELSKELLGRQGIINGLNLQVTEAEATRLNLEWKLGEATAALTDVRRERDLLAEALGERGPLLDAVRAWRTARTAFGATRMEPEHDVLWAATEQLEAAVDALGAEVGTPSAHRYLSTACQHGLHGQCRQVCKFCEVGCGCDCGHPVREEVQAPQLATAEQLAQLFHETYERLAPQHSYETRKASAKPWADVPENNRALMVATCGEVLAHMGAPVPADRRVLDAAEAWRARVQSDGEYATEDADELIAAVDARRALTGEQTEH